MSNTLSKILKIVLAVIMAITVILGALFYIKVAPNSDNITEDLMKYVNWIMIWGVILLLLTAFVTLIIGPVMSVITNPKGIVKSLISIGIILVIFVIGYAMSNVEEIHLAVPVKNLDATQRIADTSLYSMYILGVLGIFAIIFAEVKSLLKF